MRRSVLISAAAVAVTLLAGCAATASDSAGSAPQPADAIAAPGQVQAQGTVLQKDGEPAQLCLGAIAESYPPQCSGLALAGWDWATVEGQESASGVTWGAYVVSGTWDGITFTAQSAMQLALYDPMPIVDPLTDPANAGDTPEAKLLEIQKKLDDASFTVLSSWPANGYLFVQPIYDDGTIQAWVDAEFGPDRVAIRPALRDI